MRSLAVFGGTGFLGRHICKKGILNGWSVSSISRTVPQLDKDVIPNLEYISGDIFKPDVYRNIIESTNAVVHTVGSFMDHSEYKKVVNAPLVPSTVFKLAQLKLQGRNPMSNTLQRLNYDSAMVLAQTANEIAAKQERVLPFVYISAENWSSLADPNYIATKRRAEHDLMGLKNLRPVFLRPGFMYDSNAQPECWPSFRSALTMAVGVKDKVSGQPPSRISVQAVAAAAVEAAEDDEIIGVVSNEALAEFDVMR
ncbi:MIOREX complex component 2 [Wickerhamiella sorbophila]|uniref:MIOREX complex component 2 n=1 Tax=Wickerhamiella sorbophila TaxID=45607 RepID=A0A2T0FEF1_9ASCO|nr:MIOREX complex component 2 [Wickerhamiella sorbophila]PRT53376.1 MIOREX complex component 2 [Wickerhamiella sorbophila]